MESGTKEPLGRVGRRIWTCEVLLLRVAKEGRMIPAYVPVHRDLVGDLGELEKDLNGR